MSPEWENIVEEIVSVTCLLSALDLNICTAFSPTVELRRHLLQCLVRENVTSREDQGMSLLLELNDKIDEVKWKNTNSNQSIPQQMAQEHHHMDENVITSSNPGWQNENASVLNGTETSSNATQNLSFVHPLYRRELKIIGQIGEPNQKDKLMYTSLEKQIQRAFMKII